MKVLVIISSLRRKNTFEAIREIERVHATLDEVAYEYLFLKDVDLHPCRGCHLCLIRGEDACPLKDDRDRIQGKIEAADAVILASPNHCMNVNWLMKNFIDRFSWQMHRPRYFEQRFMILITSGASVGVKQAHKALAPIVSGGTIISRLTVLASPAMTEKRREKQLLSLRRGARTFARQLAKPWRFRPTLATLAWFAAFKTLSTGAREQFPADYAYYADKQYFVNVPLRVHHRVVNALLSAIFKMLARSGVM